MKFDELQNLVNGVDDFTRYGGNPLGVLAEKRGVFNTKDNYTRRERLVNEWARSKYGEYAEGLFRAVNGMKPLKRNRDFERGYKHGRKLIG